MKMCLYDEAFTKDEMLEETGRCTTCNIKECSHCGMDSFNEEKPLRNDTISRVDAIERIKEKAKHITNEDTLNGLCGAISILWDMPSAEKDET